MVFVRVADGFMGSAENLYFGIVKLWNCGGGRGAGLFRAILRHLRLLSRSQVTVTGLRVHETAHRGRERPGGEEQSFPQASTGFHRRKTHVLCTFSPVLCVTYYFCLFCGVNSGENMALKVHLRVLKRYFCARILLELHGF
jgi:hypothetical protein